MQNARRELEAAARDYRRAVEAMKDATEGTGHWEARRVMFRAEAGLFAAASEFVAAEDRDRLTRRLMVRT